MLYWWIIEEYSPKLFIVEEVLVSRRHHMEEDGAKFSLHIDLSLHVAPQDPALLFKPYVTKLEARSVAQDKVT